jgi:hypothetical protein
MASGPSPFKVAALGLGLVILGFTVGYGFHTPQSISPPLPTPTATGSSPEEASSPPIAKALRLSPDGKTLAFTGVYDSSRRASRFLLDLESEKWSAVDTPRGWQDYTMGWSADGSKILFDREKIPRPVEDATAGLHTTPVEKSDEGPRAGETVPAFERSELPRGERSMAGFFAPDGRLIIKTRREPKSLYAVNGGMTRIARAEGNYLQNRAVREKSKTVFFVVRDLQEQPGAAALFRIEDGREQRISEPLADVEWTYVSEDARWMIVCRESGNGSDWDWTLYKVEPQQAQKVGSHSVPGDVIGVFWSPDRKRILGASGESLWTISIPELQVARIGTRRNWNADDAAWLSNSQEVVVASHGSLWRVGVPSGTSREIWKFPSKYLH